MSEPLGCQGVPGDRLGILKSADARIVAETGFSGFDPGGHDGVPNDQQCVGLRGRGVCGDRGQFRGGTKTSGNPDMGIKAQKPSIVNAEFRRSKRLQEKVQQ